ncbi:D-xylose 1-dehydrogenase Gfo6 [Halegenticoccus tardaugens]|uniref:D-xylose 1-dehydrogenase Gfo6 n=1 Tax=Halegenticoccus tardaugens TaxID=2071624 RepID=UPI00100B8C35|nr:D-xylose 1-dehydrogenase Gfo6 [Halegenticoccus tardaugens]
MRLQQLRDDLTRRDWDDGVDGTVRVAIVGVGHFARTAALPAIAESDYCEATVLVSGSAEKARRVADEAGVERAITYDEYGDGVAADAYDAAYVVTPNALHLPHVEAAAARGKAVLCEKPLEATVERAERLVYACEDAGAPLMVAYRTRFDPVVRRVREFVRGGGVGEPIQVHGDFTIEVISDRRGPDQWRLDPDLSGGGALMDVGVYPLNAARFLLDADPEAVTGTTSGDGPFADVDEHVAFGVEFPDGVTGAFTANFSGFRDSRLSILGTEGRIEIERAFDYARPRRVRAELEGARISFDGPLTDEIREEFDYFARCLLAGESPGPDGQDGLNDMRTMAAVYEAAERGERVEL